MKNLIRDALFGVRMLVKGRAVSAIVVLTLALAIGVTSTIFSLVGTVLVHPFPYLKDPANLVWFFQRHGDAMQSSTEQLGEAVPVTNFFAWKTGTTHFEDFAGIVPNRQTVEGAGEPARVKGFAATPNYFRLMGTKMAFGRDFNPDEDTPGRDQVAVLGYAFAERRFGSAAAAVGQKITTQGRSRTIVGVLSHGFAFPGLTDLWVPLVIDPEMRANKSEKEFIAFGRLKPGSTTEAANRELAAMAPRLANDFPDVNRGMSAQVLTLHDVFMGKGRPIALLQLLVALLLLLVAATNVGSILLAQGAARRAEFALRAALGAARGRLIGQLLTECLILCATGGALGLLVSMWALDLFTASMPERIASRMRIFWELRFDVSWTLVAVGVTLLTTLVAGLWPAWRVSDTRVNETLKEQGGHASTGRGHRRILRGLVTGQIAIALALLTGATCIFVDLVRTERQKLGFEPNGLMSAMVTREESDDQKNARFFEDLSARIRTIPGVEAVGLTSYPPLSRGHEGIRVAIPGRPRPTSGEEPEAKLAVVDGAYFKVSATQMLEGNVFTIKDDAAGPAVAVLSRRAADTFYPGQSAIGKTIELSDRKRQTACTIIGIVDDIAAYRNQEMGMIYRPFAQEPRAEMAALVRGANPDQFERAVHDAVYALDHRQPVETRPLRVHVDEFLWAPRMMAYVIAIPAALAILLSVLGVYGLAAYSVAQRRTELGIRAALGAPPRALVALVMREALWIAGIGGSVGLGVAVAVVIALGRAEVQGLSPASAIALGIGLIAIVLLASYGPAQRAARASPSLAMR